MWGKRFGGIGRYVKEIVSNLLVHQCWDFVLLVGDDATKHCIQKNYPNKCDVKIVPAKIFSLKEQLLLPLMIPACDIFWSPYMNVPFLPCRAKYRVVTIHDVFHLANPRYYSRLKHLFIGAYYHFSCRKSNLILTVSDFSKQEIREYCGDKAYDKTITIYNGSDIDAPNVSPMKIDSDYILFVGNIKPHKNLKNALLGFQKMGKENLKFVIVGKKEGFITADNGVFSIVEKLNEGSEKVTFTGNISDDELYRWYKGAKMLIQPSFYEGFGLPIIEAMTFGLPIVCSDIQVFKEIGGDKLTYFDPYSPQSICNALEDTLKLERQTYSKWITWENTAELIAKQFTKLVETKL